MSAAVCAAWRQMHCSANVPKHIVTVRVGRSGPHLRDQLNRTGNTSPQSQGTKGYCYSPCRNARVTYLQETGWLSGSQSAQQPLTPICTATPYPTISQPISKRCYPLWYTEPELASTTGISTEPSTAVRSYLNRIMSPTQSPSCLLSVLY
jgi:hypothetical protein